MPRIAALTAALALVVSTSSSAAEYRESGVTDGGSVSGRIYFEGETPPAETVRPDRDADACGIRIPTEEFVVGDSKGLANVVVQIEGISTGKPFDAVEAEIQQLECRYQPRVAVIRPGQSLGIVNQDPILHNVHAYSGDSTLFNLAQPFQGQVTTQTVTEEGIVRVKCDVHGWMEAWVVVLDNPYFAISNQAGNFTIDDVPPGQYSITMWHEVLGTSSKPVSVGSDSEARVDFVIGE